MGSVIRRSVRSLVIFLFCQSSIWTITEDGRKIQIQFKGEALAMKRAIHRQYGNNRHCHGVALFVDIA